MAEAVGLASGLLALATFAFQSSITLVNTVKSYRNHPAQVRDLIEELEALNEVLAALTETIKAAVSTDLSALDRPLLRCGHACEEFMQELNKCASYSEGSQLSFRGWAKLKYMGDDIDSFRRLLGGYKVTINMALTNATLRASSATADSLDKYRLLVATANSDLQDHFENVNEKLDGLLAHATSGTESDAADLDIIREERLSAQRCLAICDQLSKHIEQVQLDLSLRGETVRGAGEDRNVPEMLFNEGLQGCRDTLGDTVAKLERLEKDKFERLMNKTKQSVSSKEDLVAIARLREEWENTRQSLAICSEANNRLKENISVISNYGTGDAMQFMVSTNGKTIRGENRGHGWRTRQVGGHMNEETVRQLSRDMTTVHISSAGVGGSREGGGGPRNHRGDREHEGTSQFGAKYGQGQPLGA